MLGDTLTDTLHRLYGRRHRAIWSPSPSTAPTMLAVITGPVTVAVAEVGGVANMARRYLDRDLGDQPDRRRQSANDAWTAISTATASASGFGTYTLTATGVWAYTLDNKQRRVQALNTGQTR